MFCTDKVVDPAGKFNIVGGTLNAIGGSCFDISQVEKGSKPYAVASFADVKKGEAIRINGKDAVPGTAVTALSTAKVVLINDTLKAGGEVEVKVGSQTAKAKVE